MNRPWTAERELDEREAAALIGARWPELAALPIRTLAGGWDNCVFQLGDDLVFRFPRRQVAVELALTEIRVLPGLAGRLPLVVPDPEFVVPGTASAATEVDAEGDMDGAAKSVPKGVAEPSAGADWPFAGYRMLAGETADEAVLTHAQRRDCAVPLARFLRALHGLPPATVESLGAPPDEHGRLDLSRMSELCLERLDVAVERGLLADRAPIDAEFARAPKEPTLATTVLAHGDLHARNVLVNGAGQLTGVIDWGDCHQGDPAVDLAMAHAFLPPSAHDVFRREYGPISEESWALARLRALTVSLTIAVYADDVGRRAQCAEACWALQNMLSPDG